MLVLCPAVETGLATLMRDVQQIYTMRVNQREGWSGFLWQGRYHSCAMDEGHALAALRYVERNPVAAGLCAEPEDWPWSSSRHHTGLEVDPLVTTPEFLARIGNWRAYLRAAPDNAMITRIGHYTRSGAPLGAPDWVREIEARIGRSLGPPQRGRPKRHR